jgi:chromosome segregation ATPase
MFNIEIETHKLNRYDIRGNRVHDDDIAKRAVWCKSDSVTNLEETYSEVWQERKALRDGIAVLHQNNTELRNELSQAKKEIVAAREEILRLLIENDRKDTAFQNYLDAMGVRREA